MISVDDIKYKFTKEMLEKCLKNINRMDGDEKIFLEKLSKRIAKNLKVPIAHYELLQEFDHRF